MRHLSYSLAILIAATLFAADEKPKSDKEMIQGTWDIVSTGELGKPQSATGRQIIFAANIMTYKDKEFFRPGIQYKLDATKKPKEIDTSHELDPGNPIIQLGVYSLDGDTLKLRLAAAGEPRPAKLEPKAGEFFVCKRVKKEGK